MFINILELLGFSKSDSGAGFKFPFKKFEAHK